MERGIRSGISCWQPNTYVTNPTTSGYVRDIVPAEGSPSNLRLQSFETNAEYDITPTQNICPLSNHSMASFKTISGKSNPNYQIVGLMAGKFLSKGTDPYVQGVHQHAAATARVMSLTWLTSRVLMALPTVRPRPSRA